VVSRKLIILFGNETVLTTFAVIVALRCFPAQAGEKDGNLTAREIHLHFLRKGVQLNPAFWVASAYPFIPSLFRTPSRGPPLEFGTAVLAGRLLQGVPGAFRQRLLLPFAGACCVSGYEVSAHINYSTVRRLRELTEA